jgi:2,4-dienoyl-CoA reductase-like NADH-dependent reductase (Old Yellow Enzyme family)
VADLFEPLTLRGTTFRNRLWVSPMCQYSAVEGQPNDWHLVHLGQFAVGGFGLVMTEATAVSPEGRISPGDAGLWHAGQTAGWARVVAFLHAHGAVAGMQLAHAGRKASTRVPWQGEGTVPVEEGGWPPLAPSPVAFPGYVVPAALDEAGLVRVRDDFVAAARRALAAGFDLVEVHAAHGYLLHEFLSPLSNRRDDAYGGSLENRMRLLLEVAAAVRAVWPEDRPVLVRISATDWADGGWTPDEAVVLAGELAGVGVDLVDTSSGGLVPASIPLGPGYQVPFAGRIRREAGVPTASVGLITEADQAQRVVGTGEADAVLLARAALRDPHAPLRWAEQLGQDVSWPSQYLRARPYVRPR